MEHAQDLMEEDFRPQQRAVRRRHTGGRAMVIGVLAAFLLGAGVVGWLGWNGKLDRYLPQDSTATAAPLPPPAKMAATPAVTPAPVGVDAVADPARVATLESRLAMLEDRLSRVNFQASAASGNAARAEGLLIAFAARRMIDRGQPLGYLEDQLKLRFTNAQPRAVQTLTTFAQNPVTLEQLVTRLDTMTPKLADFPPDTTTWSWLRAELGSLFTVHRERTLTILPEARIGRAKLLLAAGRVEDAIAQISRLPGAEVATDWIADARRFGDAQQALDLIETTAMIERRGLQDGEGRGVEEPSPLAQPPLAQPTEAPVETGSGATANPGGAT